MAGFPVSGAQRADMAWGSAFRFVRRKSLRLQALSRVERAPTGYNRVRSPKAQGRGTISTKAYGRITPAILASVLVSYI